MPQAVSIAPPKSPQPLDRAEPRNSIPGQRVNYNRYPDIAGDYTVGVLNPSETFAGVDPNKINFKFPLRAGQHGFFDSNTTKKAAIKEDLKSLLLTAKGERVIQANDFGTNIPTLAGQLFENTNIEELQMLIEAEVRGAIMKWMPFLQVNQLVVNDSETDSSLSPHQVRVSIAYSDVGRALPDTISFTVTGA